MPHAHAHAHGTPTFVTGPASPLGRATGRSLRPRAGARDRAAGKSAAAGSSAAGAGGAAAGDDMGEEYEVELGMKRRWPGGSSAGGAGGAAGGAGVVELAPPGEGLEHGMDVEGMGMEGWDGIGERPFKRVTRRAAQGGADGAAAGGGAGDGGAAEAHR